MNLSRAHPSPIRQLKAKSGTPSGFGGSFEDSGSSQNSLAWITSWSPETFASSSGSLPGENGLLDHLLLFPFNFNLTYISF